MWARYGVLGVSVSRLSFDLMRYRATLARLSLVCVMCLSVMCYLMWCVLSGNDLCAPVCAIFCNMMGA